MDLIPIPKLPWNIYWINLDRRPDRKEHMERLLINNTENNFRIQAVDYKNNFIPYNVIKHPKLNEGEHGCICSHIKALAYFLDNSQDEYCFIAEDDISNEYSNYWQKKHFDLINKSNIDIIQMQTTTDAFDDPDLKEILMQDKASGAAFYRIRRNIAIRIIETHFDKKTQTINLSNHNHPVADHLIWSYGNTYLIPMISYLNINDSDTNDKHDDMSDYYIEYFKNAKNKYLDYWKQLK
jgi:GR25 family glycosyltransferase involved in LPS biosynthesis